MKQPHHLDPYHYEVSQDEEVSFLITEHGTERLITISLDGQSLLEPFKFVVTKLPGGRHFVETRFEFDPQSASDAWYEISVAGSKNGTFPVLPVRKTSGVKNPGFAFVVAA